MSKKKIDAKSKLINDLYKILSTEKMITLHERRLLHCIEMLKRNSHGYKPTDTTDK